MTIEKWQRRLGHYLDYLSIEKNVGLGEALNLGLKHCKCRYVARMDSDDESLPNRFKRQIDFLKTNRNVVLIGCQAEFVNLASKGAYTQLPCDAGAISEYAKFRNPSSIPPSCLIGILSPQLVDILRLESVKITVFGPK